jgi:transcriptional regulator with XRE-family HTH domain
MQRGWVISPEYRAAIDAIRKVRTERNISQRELARRLGKPPSFVNKIEQLERRLDVLEFVAIARALEIDAPELTRAVAGALPKKWSL